MDGIQKLKLDLFESDLVKCGPGRVGIPYPNSTAGAAKDYLGLSDYWCPKVMNFTLQGSIASPIFQAVNIYVDPCT